MQDKLDQIEELINEVANDCWSAPEVINSNLDSIYKLVSNAKEAIKEARIEDARSKYRDKLTYAQLLMRDSFHHFTNWKEDYCPVITPTESYVGEHLETEDLLIRLEYTVEDDNWCIHLYYLDQRISDLPDVDTIEEAIKQARDFIVDLVKTIHQLYYGLTHSEVKEVQ